MFIFEKPENKINKTNISDQDTQETQMINTENSISLNTIEKEEGLRLQVQNMKLLGLQNKKDFSLLLYERFLNDKLKNWNYSNLKDEFRPEYANKSTGGIDYANKELVSTMRSTGYDVVKQIGKKIITGDFNLTTISFPIKVMLPLSILEAIAKSVFQFPVYLNLAANQIDPLEKFKFAMVATVAGFHASSNILKPLNPILGETFETFYDDGSKIYLEQSSHHPPISHYIMYGPNNTFKLSGFSHFTSSAGLNSLKLYNKGKRIIELNDGTRITTTFCNEIYSNTFWGTVRHESIGEIGFKDLTNGFECVIKFNSVKKKPSDYFSGEIKLKNLTVSKVYGSYLSFVEFNNIRYWDIRENVPIKLIDVDRQIKSSSVYRVDRLYLKQGKLNEAQIAKEELEDFQRKDKKLRDKFKKANK